MVERWWCDGKRMVRSGGRMEIRYRVDGRVLLEDSDDQTHQACASSKLNDALVLIHLPVAHQPLQHVEAGLGVVWYL